MDAAQLTTISGFGLMICEWKEEFCVKRWLGTERPPNPKVSLTSCSVTLIKGSQYFAKALHSAAKALLRNK